MGDQAGEGGEKFSGCVEVEILLGDTKNDGKGKNGIECGERQAMANAEHDGLGTVDDIAGELLIAEKAGGNISEADDDTCC